MVERQAYAKINLTLDIKGIREDGYHEVAMYMQTIGLADTIAVEKRNDGRYSMTIAFEDAYRAPEELLTADENNLCIRAAKRMAEKLGKECGYDIALTKRIPVGAGLAGGSTDAAAVLRAINELEGNPLSAEELCAIGGAFGADIPYCVLGQTYFASGTGTTLDKAADCPRIPLLLIKPEISMATGEVYHNFDALEEPFHPDNKAMAQALEEGDVRKIEEAMGNSLEAVVAAVHPIIGQLKAALYECGSCGAMMSGSGSCVYGLFEEEKQLHEAAKKLRKDFPACFICETHTLN